MRILFVEPPVDYSKPYYFTGVHLGLLSIVGYLRKHAPSIECDFISLQLLKASGKGFSLSRLFHDLKPNIVCLTAITSSFPYAVEIAKQAKKTGSLVILGGIFASLNAESIISNDLGVDIVVRGEGEKTVVEIVKAVTQKRDLIEIQGITFKQNGKILSTASRLPLEISEIPTPAYDSIAIKLCHRLKLPATVETSRGCPYRCAFCTLIDDNVWGRYYREKSISQVIQELKCVKESGFERVEIADASFAVNERRTVALCNELIKQNLGLRYRVECRVDLLNRPLLEEMSKAGIDEIILGVERIDPGGLFSMRKTLHPKEWKRRVVSIINEASKLGIITHPVIMLGWSGETLESLGQLIDFTISLLKFQNVQPFIAFPTPHPGSYLYQAAEKLGLKIITRDLTKYIHLYPVAIPSSLGRNALNAVELLVNAHNTVRIESGMTFRNPLLDVDFVLSYADAIDL